MASTLRRCALTLVVAAGLGAAFAPASSDATSHPSHGTDPRSCPPSARALGYSDALDKLTTDGAEVGGLSALAWDSRRHAYAAIEDHSGDQVSRMWFFQDAAHPRVTGTMTLSKPDGTAYDGTDMDAEGLAVLPDGDYLVSSEVEPSIRIFDRTGRQVDELPVPARFRVAPAGEATANATLEGLTISPDGHTIYAAMEGTLSGDISSAGVADFRRILVYRHQHGGWALARQIGYRVQPGNRISEAQAYDGGLLIMEAAYDATKGNSIQLFALHPARARSVDRVSDLGDQPRLVARKTLVSDVTSCPTLGATAKEPQTNPLMDNFEGMAIRPLSRHESEVLLVSDDNFSATQTTRLLRLAARLPR